jgi:hypothetical protein
MSACGMKSNERILEMKVWAEQKMVLSAKSQISGHSTMSAPEAKLSLQISDTRTLGNMRETMLIFCEKRHISYHAQANEEMTGKNSTSDRHFNLDSAHYPQKRDSQSRLPLDGMSKCICLLIFTASLTSK